MQIHRDPSDSHPTDIPRPRLAAAPVSPSARPAERCLRPVDAPRAVSCPRPVDAPGEKGRARVPGFAAAALAVLLALAACEASPAKDFSFQVTATTNQDFEEARFTAVGNSPVTLAVADIDGDGDPDAAVANRYETLDDPNASASPANPGSLTVLTNDGTGVFSVSSEIPVGVSPATLMFGHLNGDDAPDLALLNESATVVTVLLNDGGGGFAARDYPLVGTAARMAFIDLNGDGSSDQDFVVTVSRALEPVEPGVVTALVNNGEGGFTLVNSLTQEAGLFPKPGPLVVDDLDEDGRPDLAVGDFRLSRVVIMRGQGARGVFVPLGEPIQVGSFPFDLLVTDMNGDGSKDIMVSARGARALWLLEGSGDGTFTISASSPISLLSSTGGSEKMLLGNFTGDGTDLVVLQRSGSQIPFLDWDGSGGYELTPLDLSRDPFALVQGDFNRDGHSDLLTAEKGLRVFSVHAGAGDGTFERTIIGFEHFSTVPTPVDVNGDGALDVLFLQPFADRMGVLINCRPASGGPCPGSE